MILFLGQLLTIMPHIRSGAVHVTSLNAAMHEFDVDRNVYRMAGFLANIAHESSEFRNMQEIADGSAYDGREDLGNTLPHAIAVAKRHGTTPGRWFKGVGPMQITGYSNLLNCGNAIGLGLDLIENPALLTESKHGCRAAAWFFQSHACNQLSDTCDEQGFKAATGKVNPPLRHYERRYAYWVRAVRVLKNAPRDYKLEPIATSGPIE